MRFSLILATRARTAELERFLAKLDAQTVRHFELVVVDQNEDDRLLPVLAPYRDRFALQHLRSRPGLSRARNVGLRHATGDVVAFPDDDCWYPENLVECATAYFRSHPQTGGIIVRPAGEDGATLLRYRPEPASVSRMNLFGRAISYTLFFRREVVEAVGGFDETLGLGATTPWGAGEDIDYPIRAMQQGFRLEYVPELAVIHPHPGGYERTLPRVFNYAAGFGRVCRKHRYPAWFMGYHLCRSAAGTLLGLCTGRPAKARAHWLAFHGKLHGWVAHN